MNLETAINKGLRSAKWLSIFMWFAFFILLITSWVMSGPLEIDLFEFMALSFSFGCALGMSAGWDTVRVEVRDYTQKRKEEKS